MPLGDFIIWVYCWVDQKLNELVRDTSLRSRGFPPKLSDAEVLTMELVGEFLGIDTDQGIWRYFRCHWREWFPQLGSRSQFAKQAYKFVGGQTSASTAIDARHGGGARPNTFHRWLSDTGVSVQARPELPTL